MRLNKERILGCAVESPIGLRKPFQGIFSALVPGRRAVFRLIPNSEEIWANGGNQGNGNTENVSMKFCRSRLPLLGRLCPGLAISLGSIVKSTDRSPSISSNRVAHALTDRGGDRLQRGDSVSKPRLYLNRSSHSKIRRRAQRFSMAFGTKLAASTHSGSLLPSALRSEQWEFSPQGPRPSSVG